MDMEGRFGHISHEGLVTSARLKFEEALKSLIDAALLAR